MKFQKETKLGTITVDLLENGDIFAEVANLRLKIDYIDLKKSALVLGRRTEICGTKIDGFLFENAKELFELQKKFKAEYENAQWEKYISSLEKGEVKIQADFVDDEHAYGWHISGNDAKLFEKNYLGMSTPNGTFIHGRYTDDLNIAKDGTIKYEDFLRVIEEREAQQKERQKAAQAERDAIFQKAKETGVEQKLYSYSVRCSERNLDCDQDIITVWAMPNGREETTREHTY